MMPAQTTPRKVRRISGTNRGRRSGTNRQRRRAKTTSVVAELKQLAREERQLNLRLVATVRRARQQHIAWNAIADALGVSKQAAWEYFARRYRVEIAHRSKRPVVSESDALNLAVRETKIVRRGRRRA